MAWTSKAGSLTWVFLKDTCWHLYNGFLRPRGSTWMCHKIRALLGSARAANECAILKVSEVATNPGMRKRLPGSKKGEGEFLFTPYSAFEVVKCEWTSTVTDYHHVHLSAPRITGRKASFCRLLRGIEWT